MKKRKAFNVTLALEALNAEFAKSDYIPPTEPAANIVVRKPYCYISFGGALAKARNGNVAMFAAGFSKCNPDDRWNKTLGLKVAFKRAVRDYVQQAKTLEKA